MAAEAESTEDGRVRAPLVAATALPGAAGGLALAAAYTQAAARRDGGEPRGAILVELATGVRRRPTLISSAAARRLETSLRGSLPAAARGAICWVISDPAGTWREDVQLCRRAGAAAVVVSAEPAQWRELVDTGGVQATLLRADVAESRSLTALAASELIRSGIRVGVLPRAPGIVGCRRALAGIEPGGELGRSAGRMARRLEGEPPPSLVRSESGQALPLVLAISMALVVAGLLLALLSAAATGGARLQRTADLAAVSAARSLRDDHHRLFVAARLASGEPNPLHLTEAAYRARSARVAREAIAKNGTTTNHVEVSFPDAAFAPTRVKISLEGRPAFAGETSSTPVAVEALAEAYPLAEDTIPAGGASGGGYSGPLRYRQGEGIRPDAARAFDRMAAAARRAGHDLVVNSGFRSDAEQAVLFAANPDPRMVARPGTSLHRCGTELDLGPPSAYGWLAASASLFGYVKRYPWEPWHYGYDTGPEPCARSGIGAGSKASSAAASRAADGNGSATALPAFVPARFRGMLTRAASRHNVSAALLAAQLMAESGFNPFAVSPAGARGIAQFMPQTAAAYGLRDPLDPAASIDAQARLMSDLLAQFGGRSALALAAYNAGPAAVSACNCVPPYAETRAYVARILGLLGGAGVVVPPALEVRLIE